MKFIVDDLILFNVNISEYIQGITLDLWIQ